MGTITINGSNTGTALQNLLMANEIQPGWQPSYQLCKEIYLYHPLGAKMVEKPIKIAMSAKRKISVMDGPQDRLVEAFEKEWKKLKADSVLFNVQCQKRIYGIASLAVLTKGQAPNTPLDLKKLYKEEISFNVYDPLNTAGSLILNQDPTAMDFQHAQEIVVDGKTFHRSRARVVMNEFPIYISYTSSGFGFVGRSVYQRSLFPLKSFVQTMITNDLVSVKAGVIIAKIKQVGSIITQGAMQMFGLKRETVKQAVVGGVLSVGLEDDISSMNFQNLEGPFSAARKFIVEDIASGAPMPAKMLTEESFAEGFGEGAEDAKEQARFVDGVREESDPLYEFMDDICQHRAWNPEFFETLKIDFPELQKMDYFGFFYAAKNSFKVEWPSLLTEPESEQVKVADVKLRALIAILQAMRDDMDDENLGELYKFITDNISEMKLMFGTPLILDFEKIVAHREEKRKSEAESKDNVPGFNMRGDAVNDAIEALRAAVATLPEKQRKLKVAA